MRRNTPNLVYRVGGVKCRVVASLLLGLLLMAVALTLRARQYEYVPPEQRWVSQLPAQVRDQGYVSSDTCQSCHPQHYASWHATYHRTMTQIATTASVVGSFNNIHLESKGRPYLLQQRGDAFWVELDDPDWRPPRAMTSFLQPRRRFHLLNESTTRPPRIERQVVMVTGSHHQQRYWLASGQGRRLDLLPFAYLIDEQRWVPSPAIFLRPHTERGVKRGAWNTTCVACHSVGGQPRPTQHGRIRGSASWALHVKHAMGRQRLIFAPTEIRSAVIICICQIRPILRLSSPLACHQPVPQRCVANVIQSMSSSTIVNGDGKGPPIGLAVIWKRIATSCVTPRRQRNPG